MKTMLEWLLLLKIQHDLTLQQQQKGLSNFNGKGAFAIEFTPDPWNKWFVCDNHFLNTSRVIIMKLWSRPTSIRWKKSYSRRISIAFEDRREQKGSSSTTRSSFGLDLQTHTPLLLPSVSSSRSYESAVVRFWARPSTDSACTQLKRLKAGSEVGMLVEKREITPPRLVSGLHAELPGIRKRRQRNVRRVPER